MKNILVYVAMLLAVMSLAVGCGSLKETQNSEIRNLHLTIENEEYDFKVKSYSSGKDYICYYLDDDNISNVSVGMECVMIVDNSGFPVRFTNKVYDLKVN